MYIEEMHPPLRQHTSPSDVEVKAHQGQRLRIFEHITFRGNIQRNAQIGAGRGICYNKFSISGCYEKERWNRYAVGPRMPLQITSSLGMTNYVETCRRTWDWLWKGIKYTETCVVLNISPYLLRHVTSTSGTHAPELEESKNYVRWQVRRKIKKQNTTCVDEDVSIFIETYQYSWTCWILRRRFYWFACAELSRLQGLPVIILNHGHCHGWHHHTVTSKTLVVD